MDNTKRQAIADAAAKLDKDTDAHWTKAGLPDCNALSELTGVKVTRAECSEALGEDFTREGNQPEGPEDSGTEAENGPEGNQSTDQTEGGDDAQAEQAEGAQAGDETQGPEAPDTSVAEVSEAANAEGRPSGDGVKMGWVA